MGLGSDGGAARLFIYLWFVALPRRRRAGALAATDARRGWLVVLAAAMLRGGNVAVYECAVERQRRQRGGVALLAKTR